jgi:cbb3-type cytochrome oxidase subunit 3
MENEILIPVLLMAVVFLGVVFYAMWDSNK